MYRVPAAGPWWHAVGAPFERGVRQHFTVRALRLDLPRPSYFLAAHHRCFPLRAADGGMPRVQAAAAAGLDGCAEAGRGGPTN